MQKQKFFERNLTIHKQRVEKARLSAEEKERKAKKLTALKESLTIEIGLWVDEASIRDALSNVETEKKKREFLKIELDFRQLVLGTKCERSLFYMS